MSDTPVPTIDTSNSTDTVAAEAVHDNLPVIDSETETVTSAETQPVVEVQTAVETKAVEEEIVPEPVVIKPNGIQDFSISLPDEAPEGTEILELPSDLDQKILSTLDKGPNVNIIDTEEGRRWARILSAGTEYNTMNEVLVPALNEEGTEFRQNNTLNNLSLNAGAPRFKESTGDNLKGEKAIIRLVTHLGLGTVFQVPLWHSGIWVTFKPPTESELIELNRQIMAEKITFGRKSYGLLHSNTTYFVTDKIVSFAIDHIFDLTTKKEDINQTNIRDHILSHDIPSLLWGFVCTMYPKGFMYERACSNDPQKCNYVLKETLNVMKLQWTNMKALTDWQKTFMSGRQPKMKTLAEIKRYQEELTRIQKKRIILNEGTDEELAIVIKSPTISQYIESGHQWVAGIVENVDRALSGDADPKERNNTVELRGQATAMRQYAHWIESIEYQNQTIEDSETINQTLDVLTSDHGIRNSFIEAVVNFINGSTVSVIGIPVFDCPKCKQTQEGAKKLPHHTNIIPLDVMQVFFELISQRIARISVR